MSDLASWIRERVPPDTDLDRPTMSDLAVWTDRRQTLSRSYGVLDNEAGAARDIALQAV